MALLIFFASFSVLFFPPFFISFWDPFSFQPFFFGLPFFISFFRLTLYGMRCSSLFRSYEATPKNGVARLACWALYVQHQCRP